MILEEASDRPRQERVGKFLLIQKEYRRVKHLILAVTGILVCLVQSSEAIELADILDNYRKTQDSFTSFTFKADIDESRDLSFKKGDGPTGHFEKFQDVEYRYDGDRVKYIKKEWGDVNVHETIPSKPDAIYTSYLWDAHQFVRYSRNSKLGIIEKNKKQAKEFGDGIALNSFGGMNGYIPGQGQRADDFLKDHANDVIVHKEPETVNGAQCYLVEANTSEGDIKVWFDCQHGYNISKMEFNVRPEHKTDLPRTSNEVIQIERFVQIDGVWIPAEGRVEYNSTDKNGSSSGVDTIKRRDIVLNPDHNAVGSFLMDDIENGTRMSLVVGDIAVRYTWLNGKLIPYVDEHTVKRMDAEIEKLKNEQSHLGAETNATVAATQPTVAATQATESPHMDTKPTSLAVSDILARYRVTQDHLRSFIAKGQSTIEYTNSSRKQTQTEKSISEFSTDGDRVCNRYIFWDGVTGTKAEPAYKSFLWDGKTFIRYERTGRKGNGTTSIRRDDKYKAPLLVTEYRGAPLIGIYAGNTQRIDAILSKADTLSLRDKTEPIGDAQCYVIDATTEEAKYTVWFDREHGYNVAQVEIWLHGKRANASFSLKDVRFKKISGIWVPMEANIQATTTIEGKNETTKWHHERSQVLLNPDFKTTKSFVADDIPEGTEVKIDGDPRKYVWQNGNPVAEVQSNAK